jgi:hypothetical protein
MGVLREYLLELAARSRNIESEPDTNEFRNWLRGFNEAFARGDNRFWVDSDGRCFQKVISTGNKKEISQGEYEKARGEDAHGGQQSSNDASGGGSGSGGGDDSVSPASHRPNRAVIQ